MEGGDLDEYLGKHFKANKSISKDRVVEWLKQMVSALKYLHSKSIHHRDIKPLSVNIYFSSNKSNKFY